MKQIKYLLIITLFTSCSEEPSQVSYNSNKYQECDKLLTICNSTGDYCLFGWKWGAGNNFSNRGVDVDGPKMEGGLVSFSFQEETTIVSNHAEVDVPTESFDLLPDCAKENIQKAFNDWSSVANIQFEQLPDDSESDIKIFVSYLNTQGNGFPNFESSLCEQLAGHVILSPRYTNNCEIFYAYVLHEIGHSLGLGHSSGENLMGSINTNLEGLTEGDIEGIRQIYGQ